MTHLDPVLELDLSTRIDADVLEGLASTVVGLAARLESLEHVALVDTSWRV